VHKIISAHRPLEPEVGAVLRLRLRFAANGPPYTYVLFHAPTGRWYATGFDAQWSWADLWNRFDGLLLDGPVEVLAPARELAW